MSRFASREDVARVAAEMPWAARDLPRTLHAFLARAAARHGARPAVSFQFSSAPGARAETLTWAEILAHASQAANLFRRLGIGEGDTVACLLPNCTEAVSALLGGAIAGVVAPINPLLEPAQIASILRETGARVLVTLRAFPQTDVAAKAARALEDAPGVETLLEVDLRRYLDAPKSWLVPLLRPRHAVRHKARVLDYGRERGREAETPAFPDSAGDRVAAFFHTGGTTGMPKVAQHRYSGMIYNGWLGHTLLFRETDVLMCPLPMFHVFAVYPVFMSAVASGAHVVLPTPAGYRGAGVFENFWKLVERWRATFMMTVPTAISVLMQRPVDADVSSLRTAISGSAPLPVELYQRFARATGVEIAEGYGLTEASCLVSCNPVDGRKKVGSVGLALPYCDVRILDVAADGRVVAEKGIDEVGEICVENPGVYVGHTYREEARNAGLYAGGRWLRTGDLGRIDADGYIFITGRMKDLIIRGGHNIDPAMIEEALMAHPAVAVAAAIGEPDAHAGELPCAFVELVAGAGASPAELVAFAASRIPERAARPRHVEIIAAMPKTAVGKVSKNDLRKLAIARVYGAALEDAGLAVRVVDVVEDGRLGLVARLRRAGNSSPDEGALNDAVEKVLGRFTRPWRWQDAPAGPARA